MTRTFLNHEFIEVTAICAEFPEDSRRKAILVRDIDTERYGYDNWEGVYFDGDELPEDEEDARNILEYPWIDTDWETLETVNFKE